VQARGTQTRTQIRLTMKWFKLSERLRCVSWQWMLEHPRRLATSLNRMVLIVSGRYSKGWSIVTLVIARRIYHLYKKSGLRFASQYLKACQIQLMKFMAESPGLGKTHTSSTWCNCTSGGLPRIIPSSHRKILRKRDGKSQDLARIYLTIFGLHRVYFRKGTHPDMTSVEGGFSSVFGDDQVFMKSLQQALRIALPEFLYSCFPACAREVSIGLDWRPSWSSGPVKGKLKAMTNVMSFGLDASSYIMMAGNLFCSNPRLREKERREYQSWPKIIQDLGQFWYAPRVHTIGSTMDSVHPLPFIDMCEQALPKPISQTDLFALPTFGRLGLKYEGGGKIRMFTIVDSIRQSCLRPIHNWAMALLRRIPQDGTFHQTRPLDLLMEKVNYSGNIYCYDLSSATDRFPARLQREVLTWAFGPDASAAWLRIIRGRPFDVPWKRKGRKGSVTAFRVGQPLGAYSSWPVFALTHHLIVQYCAGAPSSGKWFDRYALLGDDIVIADKGVADRYLEIMERIGVKISIPKSLVSHTGCVEFAKRFRMGKVDLSPISFKSVFTLIPPVIGSLVNRVAEFRPVRRSEPFRWLGAGYRILGQSMYPKSTGRRWKRYHLLLTSPKGPFPLPHLWWHSFYAPRPVTEQDVAVVREELLSRTTLDFNPSLGIYEPLVGENIRESLIMGKWLLTYYKLMTPFLLEVIKSNDLTPWYSRPNMTSRPIRQKRIVLVRYGTMFRCWDRVQGVVRRPSRLRLTSR